MSIYLRTMRNDEFIEKHLAGGTWEMLRELAVMGGWQPAGTKGNDNPYFGGDNWDGNYYSNSYQVVTDDDARALADGLKVMLGSIPNVPVSGGNIDSSPVGCFSGPDEKAFIREMIEFFEKGGCQIA